MRENGKPSRREYGGERERTSEGGTEEEYVVCILIWKHSQSETQLVCMLVVVCSMFVYV